MKAWAGKQQARHILPPLAQMARAKSRNGTQAAQEAHAHRLARPGVTALLRITSLLKAWQYSSHAVCRSALPVLHPPGPGESGRGLSPGLPANEYAGPRSTASVWYSPGPGSCSRSSLMSVRPAIVKAGPRSGAFEPYCPGPAERGISVTRVQKTGLQARSCVSRAGETWAR